MCGFIANDGSEVVGGINPSGAGQGFKVDDLGNLKMILSLNALIGSGQIYTATTWRHSAPANGNYGMSIFNPANSGKTILIYSVEVWNSGNSTTGVLNFVTTDPGYAHNCAADEQLSNNKFGGPASAIAGSVTYDTGGAVDFGSGVLFPKVWQGPNGQGTIELLGSSKALLLPKGVASGLVIGVAGLNGQPWGVNASWAEL